MEYASESETVVDLALIVGVASVGLAAVMMVLILAIHGFQLLREHRSARIVQKWRPILIRCIDAVPRNLPRLRKPEIIPFLNLWTHLQETLVGAARDNLTTVARTVGLEDIARRMLEKGSIRQQLMAVTTLGHLRDRSVWYVLITMAQSTNSILSLAATRAMIHIDPKGAMALLTSLMASRTDWAPSRVIAILNEAHPDIITIPLASAALRAPPSQAPRLIRYLSAIHSDYAMETIGLIIRTSEQQEVLAACLEMLKDPRDAALARAFVDHKNWNLRVLAASALGRIGTEEEEPVLKGMLHDSEWWVRYTAARSLADLSPDGKEKLKQIEADEQHPEAREILRLVIAELDLV